MTDTDPRYRIPEHLLIQSVRDETVILDPTSGVYYTLDAVGTRMLTLYRACGEVEATVATIVTEYAVSADTATDDLLRLLADMAAQGLAEVDHR